MNMLEYNLVRKDRPDLFLPDYYALSDGHRVILGILTPDRLIARRTARLLARQYLPIEDLKDSILEPEPEPEL